MYHVMQEKRVNGGCDFTAFQQRSAHGKHGETEFRITFRSDQILFENRIIAAPPTGFPEPIWEGL